MATTVERLIKKSLKIIVVAADEASIPAIEVQDFIFTLNHLVAEWESDSKVDLTWTDVDSVDDVLPCPKGIILPLAIVMAAEMADEYGVQVSPKLYSRATQAKDRILTACSARKTTLKPATLPIGSGNEDTTYLSSLYYSGAE